MLLVDKLCLGRILPIHLQLQVSAGESYHYCLTLWGVKVPWRYSSTESTLVPGGQSNCTVLTTLIAPVSDVTRNRLLFRMKIFMSSN